MMEMVINGVSTRKVELITEELCDKKFSKSTISALCQNLDPMVEAFRTRPLKPHYPFLMVDAIYLKAREDGRVQSRGLLIAIGVNEEGQREIIGFGLANSLTCHVLIINSFHGINAPVRINNINAIAYAIRYR